LEPAITRRLHFSVDDVLSSLIEVTDRSLRLFEHPFFGFLEELHRDSGCPIDLYLFLEHLVDGGRRTLREVSDHVRQEFQRANWLRLGPHGLDDQHPPYQQSPSEQRRVFGTIYREIERFAGPHKRSRWVRLHCFSEAFALADFWRAHGVTTLLTTDGPAIVYGLPAALRWQIARHGTASHLGLEARRSHERAERLVCHGLAGNAIEQRLDEHLTRHGCLVLFTHEIELRDPRVRAMCRRCVAHALEFRSVRSPTTVPGFARGS
jgi:hypothetical protein